MLRSRGVRTVLAVAGMAVMAGAATAVPVMAAPAGPGLFGFGLNQYGGLGDGTVTQRNSPVPVGGGLAGASVTQVSAGGGTSAAVRSDGTAWVWGDNFYGQLGRGTVGGSWPWPNGVPYLYGGITQVAVSSGGGDVYAVQQGVVKGWGLNGQGQLGNGTTTDSTGPVLVAGLSGIVQVSAGPDYALALRNDGTVWAWGGNENGQLGTGNTTRHLTPVRVPGLTGITQVSASGSSFAVRSDGTLFAWGADSQGALGNGGIDLPTATPTQVAGLPRIVQVASSGAHTLALTGYSGRVWAWGANGAGELGDGTTTQRLRPEQTTLVGITQVAASASESAAVRSDGTLLTWGSNSWGGLGQGTCCVASNPVPAPVTSLRQVSQVALGGDYGLAVGESSFVTVPSLTGDNTAAASQQLQAAGLVLGTVTQAVDNMCNHLGTVMSQNPLAGSTVSFGSAVSITIGAPPPHPCP
jgi:alpha-tubulin suppressor-like RCC1 family protein